MAVIHFPETAHKAAPVYSSTIALLGQVIAMYGRVIAREHRRVRPDERAIGDLERGRAAAIAACRTLSSADPVALDRVRREYASVYLSLAEACGAASV